MATVMKSHAFLLSERARKQALDVIDRDDPPLPRGSEMPGLLLSPHLSFLNRHWVVEPSEAQAVGSPAVLRWLRAPLSPLWDLFSRITARAVLRVLVPYFLHEREFFAHLVRFSNEAAAALDRRSREYDRLAEQIDRRSALLREDLIRLRDQVEAEIERLGERMGGSQGRSNGHADG